MCDQPRNPWHLDYPQNLGWGSYYSIHLLVGNKLCTHPDLLCMLTYFSQICSWPIGCIYIVIDSYKISNNFIGSAVLIVTTVIFRLVAFCCYLRHISVRQSPAIVITPQIFLTSSVTDVYVYGLLIFMFTDCFLSEFIMRAVIFQGSNSDRVHDSLLSCAVQKVGDC